MGAFGAYGQIMISLAPRKAAPGVQAKTGTPQAKVLAPEPPDEIIDEKVLTDHIWRLKKRIFFQTMIILFLGCGLFVTVPFAEITYQYYAVTPEKLYKPLLGLSAPNLTNKAILSWATTTITDIMTMGFGDMDVKVPKQRVDFTAEGWQSYAKAFVYSKIGDTFKHSQLVLTTVPADTPVIIGQGLNADRVYQWVVQMPVIMTYATNNNVTAKKNGIVTLMLVRVSADENPNGIAINNWSM